MINQIVIDEILANHFRAITEEMSQIVLRAAHSPFVRETQDYATALVTTDGEMFAYPHTTGVTSLMGIPLSSGVQAFDEWHDGDIMITNDPYSTNGMVMHLPDLHLLKPVFYRGELICFAWVFMHCSDVGGVVPGSIDMLSREIYQEGFRLSPRKLFRKNQRNEDVWQFIADNSRIPEMNHGDLEALVAALNAVPQHIERLIDRYTLDQVKRSMFKVIDNTEERTKAILARINPGSYHFVDYLEDDCVSDHPVRIDVTLIAKGDGQITLDFTGTDPAVQSALNLPSGGQLHHPFLCIAAVNYVVSNAEAIHLNAGILRCIHLMAPTNTIVNADFPAACGMRYLTAMRVHDAVQGALSVATDHDVPAAGAGEIAVTVLAIPEPVTGAMKVSVANPVQGGTGGGPELDGAAGLDYPTAFLRNVPAEILETDNPVHVHKFGLVEDSEGPGKLRGGHGVEFYFEILAEHSRIIMRGKERYRFNPWGVAGGHAGGLGSTRIFHANGECTDIGKRAVVEPAMGDRIVIQGAGGGGYGDPFQRDIELVSEDVENGLLSRARAESCYGVVFDNSGRLDRERTQARRAGHSGKRRDGNASLEFHYGPARSEFDTRYSAAITRMARWLPTFPPRIRPSMRSRFYRKLFSMPLPLDEKELDEVFQALTTNYTSAAGQ